MFPIPSTADGWSLYRCDKALSSSMLAERMQALLREIILDTCAAVMDGMIKAETARDHAMSRWERHVEKFLKEQSAESKDYGCFDTEPRAVAWSAITKMLPEPN